MNNRYKITYRCFNCAGIFTKEYIVGVAAPENITCQYCGVGSKHHDKISTSDIKENVNSGKKILLD